MILFSICPNPDERVVERACIPMNFIISLFWFPLVPISVVVVSVDGNVPANWPDPPLERPATPSAAATRYARRVGHTSMNPDSSGIEQKANA